MAIARRRLRRAREIRVQATILAVVLAVLTAVEWSAPGPYGRVSGQPKGTDFITFYTAATAAHRGDWEALDTYRSFHALQGEVAPFAAEEIRPPVYPPHVALASAPLARLPYGRAFALWVALSVVLYGGCVWAMWRLCPALRRWPSQVACCALAFPAFVQVLWNGQIAMLALVALTLAFVALERGWRWRAGLAIGILGFKLSLFAPAVALLVLAGEWPLAAGACVVGLAQYLVAVPFAGGIPALLHYVANVREYAQHPDILASKPYVMHSLRTFWRLLFPDPVAQTLYWVTAIAAMFGAVGAWRRTADTALRVAILCVVVVLVAPHLFVYDLVVLVPAMLVLADRSLTRPTPGVEAALVLLFITPLLGRLVQVVPFQVSTVCIVWLLVSLARMSRPLSDPARLDVGLPEPCR